jgi:acetyl esterase/lipase
MRTFLPVCVLLTAMTAASANDPKAGPLDIAPVKVRLALDNPSAAPPDAAPTTTPSDATTADAPPAPSTACAAAFSRNLKYGDSDLNVLDVATAGSQQTSPRPVLLFVAGDSFAGEGGMPDAMGRFQDQAMCFAARHGMVGVKVNYRLAPAYPWPAGARDVAAAASWVHENIDLFGGSRDEIIAVGYSVGAFHVASLLGHPEFQERDTGIAAAALVSGIYHLGTDASPTEKAYFGADPSKYDERSAFPGILTTETPLLLAWSVLDPPSLVTQAETLKQRLCNSIAHCPHTSVLKRRDDPSAVFGLDGSDGNLAEPILELVREIEARGLP